MADVPHRSQTGLNAAHPPFYASESDPTTTLGAHRVWLKPSTGVIKRRNAANTAWDDISIEGTSAGSAPSLADLSDVDVITTPPGDGEALVWDDTAGEWVPGSVAAGSVDAADVAYAGGTGMSATNVETAIDELATEKANDTALTAHIDDTADAHDATAISYAGGTGMSATHVEGAIDELATEKANDTALTAHVNDTSDAHDASAISVLDTAAQYTSTDVEGALAEVLDEVQAHEADTTDAHDASAISIVDSGAYFTSTHVEGALQELGAGGGGGGVADLDDLTDVVITSPATDDVLVYNGTSWVNDAVPGGGGSGYRTLVTLGSDVTNSTTSAADVTGLSFSVTSGTTYRFYALIIYTVAATSTGTAWGIDAPASPTLLAWNEQFPASSSTTTVGWFASLGVGSTTTTTPSTAGNLCIIQGVIKPSASGTFVIRFLSEVGGSAVVAKAGSTLEWW